MMRFAINPMIGRFEPYDPKQMRECLESGRVSDAGPARAVDPG
jgi:hypothetical protein